MKLRKITALGLAAVMTAGMLTGCGGGESKDSAAKNESGDEIVNLVVCRTIMTPGSKM